MQKSFLRGVWRPRTCFLARSVSSAPAPLNKTPLYDLHVEHKATMGPFAGFSMPIKYAGLGPIDAHNWVREKVGLFDVSHMVQWKVTGKDATSFLEYATPSDLQALKPFQSTLSLLTNEFGGIVDDLMITKHDANDFYMVTNAACRDSDTTHLHSLAGKFADLSLRRLDDRVLLAIQGPLAHSVCQRCCDFDFDNLKFGRTAYIKMLETEVHIARGGYTGEDGFEVSVPAQQSMDFAAKLLAAEKELRLTGLGARDSLRLEAGMCLYGHDLDETTSPVEASISWVIPKGRRSSGGFLGFERIKNDFDHGVNRKRVGLVVEGPPAREGAHVFDEGGSNEIGVITSGSPSPTLNKNIAMGYVEHGYHKSGTKVNVRIRSKMRSATVTRMPFVPSKYFR